MRDGDGDNNDAPWLTELSAALVPVLSAAAAGSGGAGRARRRARRARPRPSTHTRHLAVQIALVLTGVRRACMLDQPLAAGRVRALARTVRDWAAHGPLAAHPHAVTPTVLVLRPAPGGDSPDQVLVVNAAMLHGARLPPVVQVAGPGPPRVAGPADAGTRLLARMAARLTPALRSGGAWSLTPTHRAAARTLPALAGWLLEYPAVYSLCSEPDAAAALAAAAGLDGAFDLRRAGLNDGDDDDDDGDGDGDDHDDTHTHTAPLAPPGPGPDAPRTGNALHDEPLLVVRIALRLGATADDDDTHADHMDMLAFSLPVACLPCLPPDVPAALAERYTARLGAPRAAALAAHHPRVRAHTATAVLPQVAL